MKTIHLAIVLGLVSLANGVQTPEPEAAPAKPKTLLVTLQLVNASTNKPYKKACTYVIDHGADFRGTTFIEMSPGAGEHRWIVSFSRDGETLQFSVQDANYVALRSNDKGASYSQPLELVDASMPRKDGSNYTIYGTDTEKLTIRFDEVKAETPGEKE